MSVVTKEDLARAIDNVTKEFAEYNSAVSSGEEKTVVTKELRDYTSAAAELNSMKAEVSDDTQDFEQTKGTGKVAVEQKTEEEDQSKHVKKKKNKGKEKGAKEGAEEGAEEGVEKGAKEGAEEGVEKGAKKAVKEGAEEGVEKGAKKAVKEGAEEGVEKVAKTAVKEGGEAVAEKIAKTALKEGVEEVAEKGFLKLAAKAAKGLLVVPKRIPIIGAAVTALEGVAVVGYNLFSGNTDKAKAETVAYTAEAAGNLVGFVAGDAARQTAVESYAAATGVRADDSTLMTFAKIGGQVAGFDTVKWEADHYVGNNTTKDTSATLSEPVKTDNQEPVKNVNVSDIEIPKDLVLETVQAQSYTPQATEHKKNTSEQTIGF